MQPDVVEFRGGCGSISSRRNRVWQMLMPSQDRARMPDPACFVFGSRVKPAERSRLLLQAAGTFSLHTLAPVRKVSHTDPWA